MVPEKIGLKGVTREGMDYEFTLVFDLDIKHNASCSKDRTSLFMDKPEFRISTATGKAILEWCNSGEDISADEVSRRIGDCKSIQELLSLYKIYPQYKNSLQPEFEAQKRKILISNEAKTTLLTQNQSPNGTDHQ